MKILLDDWQKEAIETKGNILLATGRQVGKTTTLAIKSAERMIEKKTRIIIASLTEDQAELIIQKILEYLTESYKSKIQIGKNRPTKHIIRLKNGSIAQSRAVGNTGNSLRGFTADVFIPDEASRLPNDLWAAAKPTLLTTAGEIWMASTPFGRQGYFWECFQNKLGRFKIFKISSEEVINNRKISLSWSVYQKEQAQEFLTQEKKDMPKILYMQEYGGEFVMDLMQFFSDELIQKCMLRKRPEIISTKANYYLGVDIGGRGGSESTFEVIQRMENKKLIHIENIVEKYEMTTMSERQIIHLDNKFRFNKIYIDDGGSGVGVFDHLLELDQTKRKVIAINNSSRTLTPSTADKQKIKRLLKEDLYNNLLCLMERGEIEFLDDANIFQSLKSIQFEISDETKNIKIFSSYGHICEGLIRASWCVKDKSLNIWVR